MSNCIAGTAISYRRPVRMDLLPDKPYLGAGFLDFPKHVFVPKTFRCSSQIPTILTHVDRHDLRSLISRLTDNNKGFGTHVRGRFQR